MLKLIGTGSRARIRYAGHLASRFQSSYTREGFSPELQNALQPFQNDSPVDWRAPSWRLLYHHIRELRHEKNNTAVYSICSEITRKWKSNQQTCKSGMPYMLYEELMETLAADAKSNTHHETAISLAKLALSLFDEMSANNVSISNNIATNLFDTVVQTGDSFIRYKYMLSTLALVGSRNSINKKSMKLMLNHIVRLFISTNELEGALTAMIMDASSTSDVQLSYEVNEVLVVALLTVGDVDLSWKILKSMHAEGRIYSRIWGMFINVAAQSYHYEALEWVRNAAIIPGYVVVDDWSYMRMAEIASRNGDYRMTRWCLVRIKKREVLLNQSMNLNMVQKFMVPLIESHAAQGNVFKALQFIDRMKETADRILIRDVPQLVSALCNDVQSMEIALDQTKACFQDPRTSDAVRSLMLSLVCTAFLQGSNPQWALQLYDNFTENYEITPRLDFLKLLLHHAAETGDLELIMRISYDMKDFDLPKDEVDRLVQKEINQLEAFLPSPDQH